MTDATGRPDYAKIAALESELFPELSPPSKPKPEGIEWAIPLPDGRVYRVTAREGFIQVPYFPEEAMVTDFSGAVTLTVSTLVYRVQRNRTPELVRSDPPLSKQCPTCGVVSGA
jgi:hypothetical protein